jgi:hypothetical protein
MNDLKNSMISDTLRHHYNGALPKTVRSLPDIVRFHNQGNALSSDQIYQGTTSKNVEDIDIEF